MALDGCGGGLLYCRCCWFAKKILNLLDCNDLRDMLKIRYQLSNICAAVVNCIGYRRSVIDINLSRSFPELKYGEIKKIRKEYYRYMFDLIFEALWAIFASQEKICSRVTMENPELLDELSVKYKKIILVMGHLGNWELSGALTGDGKHIRENDFSLNNIYLTYKAPRSKNSDRFFKWMRMHAFKKSRNKGGVIESKTIIRHMLKDRESAGNYIFIADQSPGDERVVTKFLNQPTMFFTGPEYIARKLKLPFVYLGMDRVDRGEYRISFKLISQDHSQLEQGYLTRAFAQNLQEDINKNKVNWLWSHKRWKKELTTDEQKLYNELYG